MAKTKFIELGTSKSLVQIPILYEDRSVLAIDKPTGWMLAPDGWLETSRNLPLAIESSIAAGDFWARSRNLKFLRYVHRLDSETSGVLLSVKSPGAIKAYSELFENQKTEKIYLAVVQGIPKKSSWGCSLRISPIPDRPGKVQISRSGKEAETQFRVLTTSNSDPANPLSLIEARPLTGRTHQIRIHLAETGHPVLNDSIYGMPAKKRERTDRFHLGLRAIELSYTDPFSKRRTRICAPVAAFLTHFGFDPRSPLSR